MKFGAVVPVLNEWRFVPAVVGQLLKVADRVAIVRSRVALSGAEVSLSPVPKLDPRVEVVEGAWVGEHEVRNAGIYHLSDCDYIFTLDSDELFGEADLRLLKNAVVANGFQALATRFVTYWKSPEWMIDCAPSDVPVAAVLVRRDVRFAKLRAFTGAVTLVNRHCHHLSYVRTDDEVREKLRTYGHAHEIVPGWFEEKWRGWDKDRSVGDLNPVLPKMYSRAVPTPDGGAFVKKILAEHGCE